VFVATENLLWTAVALALGMLIPLAALFVARARRQRKMEGQVSAFIAGLAGAAREGRGLAHGLELTAADTLAPLGDAIGPAVQRMRMGIGVEAAIEDLPARTGLASMQALVTALTAHDRTGCDLVALLDRLATRIHARD
jgi:Flp pilus assembly protein TadB